MTLLVKYFKGRALSQTGLVVVSPDARYHQSEVDSFSQHPNTCYAIRQCLCFPIQACQLDSSDDHFDRTDGEVHWQSLRMADSGMLGTSQRHLT